MQGLRKINLTEIVMPASMQRSTIPSTPIHQSRNLSPEAIMQLGFGYWSSKTLLSAIELGLFTELAGGPLDAEVIARRLKLHTRGLHDFLDALVALGMLTKGGGHYANTPETAHFLDHKRDSYVGGFLQMSSTRLYSFWGGLTEALKTGQPQNEAKQGRDLFDEIYKHPEHLRSFLKAMTGISLRTAAVIAQKFPWTSYKSFADIGAAEGCIPVAVAEAHPHLKGIGFDLPGVQPHFEAYVAARNLSSRVSFRGGDFFADPLPGADVLIMGRILHDWSVARRSELIGKAFAVLPDKGALLIYETIIDDERRQNAFGLLMSRNMLIETREGADYTGADCMGWMKEAGFRETRVEHLLGPDSMVIGIK
jgi:hypothetical protein